MTISKFVPVNSAINHSRASAPGGALCVCGWLWAPGSCSAQRREELRGARPSNYRLTSCCALSARWVRVH
jgi:hypothetical protein